MSPLLTVAGMCHRLLGLGVEDLLGAAVIDAHGRLLVPLGELVMLARVDVDADLLLLQFDDGGSRAVRLSEIAQCADVLLQLETAADPSPPEGQRWRVRVWSAASGSSRPVTSIRATSFASFVGLE